MSEITFLPIGHGNFFCADDHMSDEMIRKNSGSDNTITFNPCFTGTASKHLCTLEPSWRSVTEVLLYMRDDEGRFECEAKSVTFFPGKPLRIPVTFHAPAKEDRLGFQQELDPHTFTSYSSHLIAVALELGQNIEVRCECRVYTPRVHVSTNILDGGPCALGESRLVEFTIHNHSSIAVHWSISRVANFLFDPREATLDPNSSCSIQVRFQPSRLGPFSTRTWLHYCGGAYRQELRLVGFCFYASNTSYQQELSSDEELAAPPIDIEECNRDVKPLMKSPTFDWGSEPGQSRPFIPSTTQERECRANLSSGQLKKILMNPPNGTMSMGTLYEGQRYERTVQFANTLNQTVRIDIVGVGEYSKGINVIGSSTLVLGPNQIGRFMITIEPSLPRPDIQLLAVRVNGKLFTSLTFQYKILPIQLTVNPHEILLEFAPDNIDLSISRSITVSNPCDCAVDFSWSKPLSCLEISPRSGRILPHSSAPCLLTFTPDPTCPFVDTYIDLQFGTQTLPLHVTGSCPLTVCQLSAKSTNLGLVSVGHEIPVRFHIINSGKNFAVFHLEPGNDIQVSPECGLVPPGSSGVEILALFKTNNVGVIDKSIAFNMRSGRPLTFSISGEAIVPELTLDPCSVRGECVVGSLVSKLLTVSNLSEAESSLVCPDLPLGWTIQEIGPNRVIKVTKKSKTSIHMRFSPESVVNQNSAVVFHLPDLDLCRLPLEIESIGLSPPVSLVPSRILQLGTVAVSPVPSEYQFALSLNDHVSGKIYRWAIRMPHHMNGLLQFTPSTGCLDSNNPNANVLVTFVAKKPESIDLAVEIAINDNETILSLNVIGNVRIPSVRVEKAELCFGLIPAGGESTYMQKISIRNDGFQSPTKIDIQLTPYQNSIISLNWPKGSFIGGDIEELPLEVSLKGKKLTNISTHLDILVGGHKSAVGIKITGAIDSSLLSHPSFERNEEKEKEALFMYFGIDEFEDRAFPSQLASFLNKVTNKNFSKFINSAKKFSSSQKSVNLADIIRYLISRGAVFPSIPVSDTDVLMQVAKLMIGGTDGETTLIAWLGLDNYNMTETVITSAILEKLMHTFPYLESWQLPSHAAIALLQSALGELEWMDIRQLLPYMSSNTRIVILVIASLFERARMFTEQETKLDFKSPCGRSSAKTITFDNAPTCVKLYDKGKSFHIENSTGEQLKLAYIPRFSAYQSDAILHVDSLRFKLSGLSNAEVIPMQTAKITVSLFDPQVECINVTNPFSENGIFQITSSCTVISNVFILAPLQLNIPGGCPAQLEVRVVAIALNNLGTAILRFRDEAVGEFTIEFIITVIPPSAPDTTSLEFDCVAGTSHSQVLKIPRVNERRSAALKAIHDHSSIKVHEGSETTYLVESSSKAFKIGTAEQRITFGDLESLDLPVVFNPQQVGVYTTTVSLISQDGSDLRLFRLVGTGNPKPEEIEIRLDTYAHETITQSIPLISTNSYSFTLRGTESAREVIHFDLRDDAFIISACSPKVASLEVIVNLANETTKECLTMKVNLHVEEPLSQPRITIPCIARETSTHSLKIPAYVIPRSFTVETDLDEVYGEFEIHTMAGESYEYPIRVKPFSTAKATGSVSLTDIDTGETIWYVLDINAEPPKDAGELVMKTTAGQQVIALVDLVNPSKIEAQFSVFWEGEGLSGEKAFVIPPGESYNYQLTYQAFDPTESTGSIAFYSDQIGDVWYRLKLEATLEDFITDLGTLKCVLGTSIELIMPVKNPTRRNARLRPMADPHMRRDITIVNETDLVVQAESNNTIRAEFHPSQLGEDLDYSVIFEDKSVGRWTYKFSATVVPPSDVPLKTLHVSCDIGGQADAHISFRNPFFHAIDVRISSDSPEVEIMLRKPVISLRQHQTATIPITFSPITMKKIHCLIICSWENFEWRYLVEGTPQRPIDRTLSCNLSWMCRMSSSIVQSFPLKDLVGPLNEAETDFRLNFDLPENAALSSLSAHLLKIEHDSAHDDLALISFTAHFLKPLKVSGLLDISAGETQRWRFPITIEALRPPVDDVIKIQTTLNHPASVSFDLHNIVAQHSSFRAFLEDSTSSKRKPPQVFTVHPSNGIMGKSTDPPTRFVVTYNPKEYGRGMATALLIIETDTGYWSFLLKGSLPEYKPPSNTRSTTNFL